ncbi:hypothetical protein UPYG_G00350410 [Umbra pygmaea]|uniref:Uncharacterized protein n=1 Tax=Umbra pygmaea TaxID=75934 RepID=A0ABD0W2M8_UMBPY
MAAKLLSGEIFLVLLSFDVYGFPYHQAYRRDSNLPRVPNYDRYNENYKSRYGLPSKGGNGDLARVVDKNVKHFRDRLGRELRLFDPRPLYQSSNEGLPRAAPEQLGEAAWPGSHPPGESETEPIPHHRRQRIASEYPLGGSAQPGNSSEGVGELVPVFSKVIQKTAISRRHQHPANIKRFPSKWINRGIRPHPQSEFRAGDISNFESVFERGSSQSESEEQPFPLSLPEGVVEGGGVVPVPVKVGPPKRRIPEEPSRREMDRYGELFLTNRFPAGTITHFRTGYEHGNDNWKETHFVRYNPPALVRYQALFPDRK